MLDQFIHRMGLQASVRGLPAVVSLFADPGLSTDLGDLRLLLANPAPLHAEFFRRCLYPGMLTFQQDPFRGAHQVGHRLAVKSLVPGCELAGPMCLIFGMSKIRTMKPRGCMKAANVSTGLYEK
jgi:hypothetical protein